MEGRGQSLSSTRRWGWVHGVWWLLQRLQLSTATVWHDEPFSVSSGNQAASTLMVFSCVRLFSEVLIFVLMN
ncbi:hypothetical protein AV530_012835 [Patagioenas fasciata monilis]|uniref:Uncharacterized protein n=1 Tax=Patagioenas fasciata monilis TaxID=372326 RepID=A0A1V4J9M1_PATFA|nr:hypothetical protein AV530_012835 [Patagioenas fasciata monilis]